MQLSTVSLNKKTKRYKKDVDYGSPGGPHGDFVFIFHYSIFPKWRSENQKVKNKNGKVKTKNEITISPPPPPGLRRLMEPSAGEVGLILPVFLRKLLNTDMPCD